MLSSINSSLKKAEIIQHETVPHIEPDQLIVCPSLDMRSTRIDEFEHKDLSLIQLFNIILLYNDKIYSVCAIDHGHFFYVKPKPKLLLGNTWLLIVRSHDQSFKVSVDLESETVATLNRRIQMQHGKCEDEYVLMYRGEPLTGTSKLLDYGINNRDTVTYLQRMRKPIIRLRSNHGEIINNVNLSIELDPNIWQLTSVYPKPSITNKISFIQWNNMQVYSDGKIILKSDSENNIDRLYSSISDEQEHRMLFWEASTNSKSWNKAHEDSLCVPRDDFARILNYALKRMGFLSEDRDDLLTFVLPQLDEVDAAQTQKKIVFYFLSPDFYSTAARLIVHPIPQQIIRFYMIFGFGNNEQNISTLDELNIAIDRTITSGNSTNSGLVVHEWGTMFMSQWHL
ncbi:unnamed protein product [Rotaria magnacalcarata]|uniref:Ubiquitin-like domain-containing protein n=1 Tax=Rotaria magnacalcarata TaxID=392030 RepID=A0A816T2Y9_9BILA|nr:unnamed protein product [Rotaria magnacalcarata]